jgi:hypothetical protein
MSYSPDSHFLAVVTLLDQLDPKEYNWQRVSVILQGSLLPPELLDLFDGTEVAKIELSRILSNF